MFYFFCKIKFRRMAIGVSASEMESKLKDSIESLYDASVSFYFLICLKMCQHKKLMKFYFLEIFYITMVTGG